MLKDTNGMNDKMAKTLKVPTFWFNFPCFKTTLRKQKTNKKKPVSIATKCFNLNHRTSQCLPFMVPKS